MSNAKRYPEAWKFFKEHARNITDCPKISKLGKYRIPKPDRSGDFIYANDPGVLFMKLKEEFYKPAHNSPSVYGKIQHIVETFAH